MLVVFGRRVSRKKLGWAADFCPICRGLGPVHVTAIRQIVHLYWIPLGRAQTVGYTVACAGCGLQRTFANVPYQGYLVDGGADLVEMALQTYPELADHWGPRLEVEERIATGELTDAERSSLIAEPFEALDTMVQMVVQAGHIPTGMGLAIIGLVFLSPATAVLWLQPGMLGAKLVMSGVLVLLVFAGAISWRRRGGGWVHRKVDPLLVRALAPLRPTRRELEQTLGILRAERLAIGSRVDVDLLMDDLAAAGAEGRAGAASAQADRMPA